MEAINFELSLQKLYKIYETDMIRTWLTLNHFNLDTATEEDVDRESIALAIQDDLCDKGFTENEATMITNNQITLSLSYKLMAYMLLLEDDFTTVDECKRVIENCEECKIEEFTVDDIEKIVAVRDHIDY